MKVFLISFVASLCSASLVAVAAWRAAKWLYSNESDLSRARKKRDAQYKL